MLEETKVYQVLKGYRNQPRANLELLEKTLLLFSQLLVDFPQLLLGSYPELSNPEYKVKVTLESRDRAYLDGALTEFLRSLPADALVKVT